MLNEQHHPETLGRASWPTQPCVSDANTYWSQRGDGNALAEDVVATKRKAQITVRITGTSLVRRAAPPRLTRFSINIEGTQRLIQLDKAPPSPQTVAYNSQHHVAGTLTVNSRHYCRPRSYRDPISTNEAKDAPAKEIWQGAHARGRSVFNISGDCDSLS